VGSRATLRAHVFDLLKPFFVVWGAEQLSEAEAWVHAEMESEDGRPPVLILLADTLDEGLGHRARLRNALPAPPVPVLLLVEAPDALPRALEDFPDDIVRGRYDGMDLVRRVRSMGMLGLARWEADCARADTQQAELALTRERQALQLLSRFVSSQVLQAVRNGDALRPPQRLELSVLFSDIRGFTDATAFCAPADTVNLLNDYLPEVNRLVAEHGGQLDKFMGDGILAYFPPHPGARHHYSDRAVMAAIRVLERLEELKVQWFEQGFLPVGVGVGVTTGMVTLGTIGADERLDYTVIGSTVNLAARLQGLARGGDIVIDAPTYARVRGKVSVRDGRVANIKGFEEPVQVYNVAYQEPHSLLLEAR
jgi:class 3 adenylate cyclase